MEIRVLINFHKDWMQNVASRCFQLYSMITVSFKEILFDIFAKMFSKWSAADCCMWKRVKFISFSQKVFLLLIAKINYNFIFQNGKPFPSYRRFLMPLQQIAVWKHSDKRRNCSKQAIYPFNTMFSTFSHKLSIQL